MYPEKGSKREAKTSPFKLFTNNEPKPIFGDFTKPQTSVFDKTNPNKGTVFQIFNPNEKKPLWPSENKSMTTKQDKPNIFNFANPQTPMKENAESRPTSVFGEKNGNNQFNKNIPSDLIKQLEVADKKIETLEAQIKVLNEGLAICMKFINENVKNSNMSQFNLMNLKGNQREVNFGKLIFQSNSESVYEDKEFHTYVESTYKNEAIKNLKIENEHAKVIFTENINLTTVETTPSQWVEMSNKNIKIHLPELKNKKCEIFINNFMDYKNSQNPQHIQTVIDQVNVARTNPKFEAVDFNFDTGLLYIKCKGL